MFFIFIVIILLLAGSFLIYNLSISKGLETDSDLTSLDSNNIGANVNQSSFEDEFLENTDLDLEKPPRPPE